MLPSTLTAVLLAALSATSSASETSSAARPWYLDAVSQAAVKYAVGHRIASLPEATASEIAHAVVDAVIDQPQATSLGSLAIKMWADNGPQSVDPTELLEYAKIAATGYMSVKENPDYSSFISYAKSAASSFNLAPLGLDAIPTSVVDAEHRDINSALSSINAVPAGHQALATLSKVYEDYYHDFDGSGKNTLLGVIESAFVNMLVNLS